MAVLTNWLVENTYDKVDFKRMFITNIFIILSLKLRMSQLFHTSVEITNSCASVGSGAVVCAVQMSFTFEKIVFVMYLFEILEFCQFKCTTVHFCKMTSISP